LPNVRVGKSSLTESGTMLAQSVL